MNVHILATCLAPERYGAVALVFQTIRRGFPDANILVYGNGMKPHIAGITEAICRPFGAQFMNIPRIAHGLWIEGLVANESNPFWICDTDIVFFDKVQDWFNGAENEVLYAGRHEPTFFEDWTKTVHIERLHPSLMWFNPQLLRAELRGWPTGQEFLETVQHQPFQWHMVPMMKSGTRMLYFYDTMAGAYHSIGGTKFADHQNEAFEHLYSGSYVHMLPDRQHHVKMHDEIFIAPSRSKGLKAEQDKWYKERAVTA